MSDMANRKLITVMMPLTNDRDVTEPILALVDERGVGEAVDPGDLEIGFGGATRAPSGARDV